MFARLTKGEREKVRDQLKIHTLETSDDPLLFLSNSKVRAGIYEMIARSEADITVWDPLRNFGIGDLSNDADMGETLNVIGEITRRGNPQRVHHILHHSGTGKLGIAKAIGFDRSSFGRNSKVVLAWVRSQMNMAPVDPAKNDKIIVASGKCNNAEEFAPFGIGFTPATRTYYRDDVRRVDEHGGWWRRQQQREESEARLARDCRRDRR